MQTYLALAAAALSFAWFLVHLFLGGREVARPLRDSPEPAAQVRAVAWMCWHFSSLLILALALLFLASTRTEGSVLLWVATLLAAGMTLIGIHAARVFAQPVTAMPQGWLFAPIALLGAAALAT